MCMVEVAIPSCSKRSAGVSPAERLGEDIVEVVDELHRAGTQVVERKEAGSLEQATRQDREPDFDLVHPRAVPRRATSSIP